METTKHRREKPAPLIDGRDEMNLAEFPIALIAERAVGDQKTVEFSDWVLAPERGERVLRRLVVSGSDEYGLPLAKDDEVIVGALQLSKLAEFESPKVYFSRYQLIEILGWDHGGKSYERIDLAFNRWVGVTLYWENAWWDKAERSWVDQKFGIFDNVELYDRERLERRRVQQIPLPLSSFKWNDVMFESFRSGYLKHLDMQVFRMLGSSGAKRIYRFLDKHFYRRSRFEYDLYAFAYDKVGMSRSYGRDAGKLKEKLRPWIRELEEAGVICPCEERERFVRVGKGSWQVVFEQAAAESVAEREEPPVVGELTARGVTRGVAVKLGAEFAAERIREKVELFDWHVEQGERKSGGWLRKAIEDNYTLPDGFQTGAQRAANESRRQEMKEREAQARRAEEKQAQHQWQAREARLEAELGKYSAAEVEQLVEQALLGANSFIRERYRKVKQEGGSSLEEYRRIVLAEYLLGGAELKS